MHLITEKNEFIDWRRKQTGPFSLVATMGNLHAGHLSLVNQALLENDLCVVSIFVNPLQFGKDEDFDKYPKTLQQDLEKLETFCEKDNKEVVVFAPKEATHIFPDKNQTFVEVKGLDKNLCGKYRPGHFKGVTTVVYQLFNLIKPERAIFGQKDYQQFCIINKMTTDLGLPVKILLGEIIRDQNGLALSSRNQYLSDRDKEEALILYQSLNQCRKTYQQHGIDTALSFIENVKAQDSRFQYLELLDALSLETASKKSKKLVVAGALMMGDTRLIDNCLI